MKKINKYFISIVLCLSILFSYSFATPLDTVKRIINTYYYEDVDIESINKGKSIDEVLFTLNDPYSQYFSKEEYLAFTDKVEQAFVGIGIQIEKDDKGIFISRILDNSGAFEAGLLANDIITHIDDKNVLDLGFDQSIDAIRGPENSIVSLTILRNNQSQKIEVKRKKVILPDVTYEYMKNDTLYIEVSTFAHETSLNFREALVSYPNAKNIIVDLRSNSGGYLKTAQEIAGFFIGDYLCVTARNSDNKTVNYRGFQQDILIDPSTNVYILTNKHSASASEVLTAALVDYDAATVIGNTTYGKGVMQELFNIDNIGILKLTTYKLFSPYENVFNKVGIKPDITVTPSVDSKQTAMLIINSSNDLKYNIDNNEYFVDLNISRNPEYWPSAYDLYFRYNETLNKKLLPSQLFYGLSNIHKKVTPNKNNDISFNCTILDKSLFHPTLINAITGETTLLSYTQKGNTITFSLDPLDIGDYFIKLDKGFKTDKGKTPVLLNFTI